MSPADLPITADCWYLTGPTAVGKTAVGLELARRLGGEIISLDSMALYRGMDIGTAKPTPEERGEIPHHLIDILDPSEEFSLAEYVAAAERVVADIRARGRVPLFVGGTPLYLKSLLRGIFVGPPADWELRRRWQALAHEQGAKQLHARLAEIDPPSARRLHASDMRRIIRALEVWEKTGVTLSEHQKQFDRARPADECHVFVLERSRDQLIQRINARVDQMFANGLVDEVRALAKLPLGLGRTASQAVGYREVLDYLAGRQDLASTIELVKLRTRQFAKRQGTWFRSLSECTAVPIVEDTTVCQVLCQIVPP